jgi:hypothetical protein
MKFSLQLPPTSATRSMLLMSVSLYTVSTSYTYIILSEPFWGGVTQVQR